jgi:hypothetical protein
MGAGQPVPHLFFLNYHQRKIIMPATYYEISEEEMTSVLSKWTIVEDTNARELVFDFSIGQGVSIRVFSSITRGSARKCGGDAIRVCAVRNGKGFIKSKRVYRIGTWEKNLKKAVNSVIEQARERLSTFRSSDRPVSTPAPKMTLTEKIVEMGKASNDDEQKQILRLLYSTMTKGGGMEELKALLHGATGRWKKALEWAIAY